eukprot:TRINITY_DN1448_c0_g1_i1.p1 TRINITY_DN1448_c0_g1~~TRINITY_DN1448_c0_g1_i1.p1  ORF type:complete len:342 (+),score=35.19 TRINITY_DN1448_c0_g1_i1:81-1106(+)
MGVSDGPGAKLSARLHMEATGGGAPEFDADVQCIRSEQVPCQQVVDPSAVPTSRINGEFSKRRLTTGETVGPSSTSFGSDGDFSASEVLSDYEDANGLQEGEVAVVDLRMCASLADMKEYKAQFSLTSSAKRCATISAPTEPEIEVPAEWQGKTSIILRNLAPSCTEAMVDCVVRQNDFEGTYDYLYMPVRASTGQSKGYAFLNFRDDHIAYRFKHVFEGSNFGLARSKEKLNVRPANLQGYEQNIKHCEVATSLRASEGREPKENRGPAALGYPKRVTMKDSPSAVQQNLLQNDVSHAEAVHKKGQESPTEKQRKFCHRCGLSVSPSFRFCQYCGASLFV